MPKPRVFIGSSTEGLPIAETLNFLLNNDAEVTIWNQGVFKLGSGTLESLVEAASKFDFAVIILSADDLIVNNTQEVFEPRDNVIFELGLFSGAIGHDRTFMLYNHDNPPKIPSDLLGITAATYRPHEDGNLRAALASAAYELKEEFTRRGIRNSFRHHSLRSSEELFVYFAAPHGHVGKNDNFARSLRSKGLKVNLPYELVGDKTRNGAKGDPKTIRSICVEAIDHSDVLVVDLDSYGLDTAWEIGYADATGVRVIGYSDDEEVIINHRIVNRKKYDENFMHGWDNAPIVDKSLNLSPFCIGKKVYVCGPFKNKSAMEELRNSGLKNQTKKLILPIDVLEIGKTFPKDYPWRAREQAISLLDDCDVAVVILPRYGMDTAWQIGYAYGKKKNIVGWLWEEYGSKTSDAPIWDHWMHGWKGKITVTSLDDLIAVLVGFHQTGIL